MYNGTVVLMNMSCITVGGGALPLPSPVPFSPASASAAFAAAVRPSVAGVENAPWPPCPAFLLPLVSIVAPGTHCPLSQATTFGYWSPQWLF